MLQLYSTLIYTLWDQKEQMKCFHLSAPVLKINAVGQRIQSWWSGNGHGWNKLNVSAYAKIIWRIVTAANCPRLKDSAVPVATAKSLQSCPTLFDPTDSSPPGSALPGILQTRTLEWVAISFSNAWKWKVKVKLPSHVRLFATPWTAAYQAPPSMGFSRQESWSGVPLPSLQQFLG